MRNVPTSAAYAMAAELAERCERERRIAPELSAELAARASTACASRRRSAVARRRPSELIAAVEELARADGAAGWCVAVCATAGMLAAYLEPDVAREVFGDPAGVTGGVFAPMGQAVAGRRHAHGQRAVALCQQRRELRLADGRLPARRRGGARRDVRLVLFPREAAEVIDTWSVSGLRGTGSHDMAVAALEVPLARSASLITQRPVESGPLYAFPPFGLLAAAIAAVTLGIARGALDDVAELAGVKTPTLSTRKLAERAATQSGVARAEAQVRSARAYLDSALGDAWDAARDGGEIPVELRAAAAHGRDARRGIVGRRRRRRLRPGGRQRDLRDEPAPAPLPRRARGDPAHARRAGDVGAHGQDPARARDGRDAALSQPARL